MPPKSRGTSKANNSKQKAGSARKSTPSQETNSAALSPAAIVRLAVQQLLLDVFKNAFPIRLGDDLPELRETLQQVKGYLFKRDFKQAFGNEKFLEAYAVRWSPSRALGYADIFNDVLEKYVTLDTDENGTNSQSNLQVTCIGGGGGAEIVALAGALRMLQRSGASDSSLEEHGVLNKSNLTSLTINVLDIASWSAVTDKLFVSLTNAPPLSPYASVAAKAKSRPLASPTVFSTSFNQKDVLSLSSSDIKAKVADCALLTLLFTLNELYSTDVRSTQVLLLNLTNSMRSGSLLLVVDSPGSYSEVELNGNKNRYPMHWLLDHTLLEHTSDMAVHFIHRFCLANLLIQS